MKYRVKFQCYWYNTGIADNCSYMNSEDFDTLEEAEKFRDRINEQLKMRKLYDSNKISYSEYSKWRDSFDIVEVENGFIEKEAYIVKFFPEREESL